MANGENSLRRLIDKWLGHCASGTVRVMKFGRTARSRSRYVRVGGGSENRWAIIFFRHDDGSWKVYPPRADVPAMSVYNLAALR
ncbi:hypothetical protein SAMN05446927_0545 [Caballeronia arationis]|jgi:hypothetical protein|uniref:Uncharacterized protein n=1 Tax=Caballeronia arationis TaxID=1777142 RepID=A0A7Z7N0I5_9BURK|nr:hypothetical protein SAMN05446927_0545 [Caballeronia arationis]